MKDFADTLDEICKRPALYVGHTSIRSVSQYLSGYCHALRDAGYPEPPLMGWQRWVEKRFLIHHPAWHWSRILVHEYGSDEDALRVMPGLYSEFESEYAEVGMEGIEADLKRKLLERYGDTLSGPCPKSSVTGDDWYSAPPLRRRPDKWVQPTRKRQGA